MVIDRRTVVLSDIHANASAFQAAILLARSIGFDELVVLGDLLTYGCQVQQTLDLARELGQVDKAKFVLGNHDQLYFDHAHSQTEYYRRLPAWLRESIAWTANRVATIDLQSVGDWHQRLEFARTLLAHANPFEYGNWGYLNREQAFQEAANQLRRTAHAVGIFGHTHRHRVFISHRAEHETGSMLRTTELHSEIEHDMVVMATVAAVGQPREALAGSSILLAEPSNRGLTLRALPVSYDATAYLEAITRSGMSEETVTKLKSYFQ